MYPTVIECEKRKNMINRIRNSLVAQLKDINNAIEQLEIEEKALNATLELHKENSDLPVFRKGELQ